MIHAPDRPDGHLRTLATELGAALVGSLRASATLLALSAAAVACIAALVVVGAALARLDETVVWLLVMAGTLALSGLTARWGAEEADRELHDLR